MNTITQQAIEILSGLGEKDQNSALDFLKRLSEKGKVARNEEYLSKIDRGIKQFAEGRGMVRDIVEDYSDE